MTCEIDCRPFWRVSASGTRGLSALSQPDPVTAFKSIKSDRYLLGMPNHWTFSPRQEILALAEYLGRLISIL